ncbi:MAG: DUF1553 domain-containing protein [Pirellulales bacterium]|nr:DUF1553 domain-containing protein [Pirellulales bacterium]
MFPVGRCCVLLVGVLLGAAPLRAEEGATVAAATEPNEYSDFIRPLFAQRCFACHGALRQQSGLRLDSAASTIAGGESGPAVAAGKSAESLLVDALRGTAGFRMPPEDHGEPLAEEQIARIEAWIDAGASVPAQDEPERDPRDHWAFRAIARPDVPPVEDAAWQENAIDAFIAAAHAREGLTAVSEAPRHIWLRRVYCDLVGLPPTSEELAAYLADDSPEAEATVVDRLLASPQYGERWGRHWMDVWRYSDWYGRRSVPDVMNSYPTIWRWRDWIVQSLNEDRGYDRMVREMLAGDEIAPEDAETTAATGFIVRNWFKWNYNQWKRDLVEHTSKAFLGLTMNCAHCHDHKYDPISQEDYFRLRACFEPLELRHDRVVGEADPGPFKKYIYAESYGPIASGMIRVFDEQLDVPTYMYARGDERNKIEGRSPVEPDVPTALAGSFQVAPVSLPARGWYPGLKGFIQTEDLAVAAKALQESEAALAGARQAWQGVEQQLAASETKATAGAATAGAPATVTLSPEAVELERAKLRLAESGALAARTRHDSLAARIAAENARYLPEDPSVAPEDAALEELARAAARAERMAVLAAARQQETDARLKLATAQAQPNSDAAAQTANVTKLADDVRQAGDAVEAAWSALAADSTDYAPLGPQYPRQSTGRRTALAQWITSEENTLTARVAANYLWMWHFGRPLVESVANFGRSGKEPSHPELLDWLASELRENGWRMKPLHRTMVLSRAYRLDSAMGGQAGENLRLDPDNRWLWHFPRRRMEAEEVRDSVLYVTGGLDLTQGGPEIDHVEGLTSHRRSMYFAQHGEGKMQFLELFDGVNVCDSYRRTTSVMPQQALALANSELSWRQSRLAAQALLDAVRQQGATAGNERNTAILERAFVQILGRTPRESERRATHEFLAQQRALFATLPPPAEDTPPADTAPGTAPSSDAETRAVENLIHALLNHHDFVTIH